MVDRVLEEWIHAIRKELLDHKRLVVACFTLVLFGVVGVGMVWPRTFEARAVVLADEQNIIRPLLEGQAEVTKLATDQVNVVRERVFSRRILESVIDESRLAKNPGSASELDSLIGRLKGAIEVRDIGSNLIQISYRSASAEEAYKVASSVASAFIQDSAKSKRDESRSAFTFIDNQVKTYKEQLQAAEERLKQFKSENTDGTEESVNVRVASLRATLEELRLDRQEALTRKKELTNQLASESEFLTRRYRADVYRERLAQATSRLENERLEKKESHPDIVGIKQEIENLQQMIAEARETPADGGDQPSSANPVYEGLRANLAETEVDVRTLDMRIQSTERLLESEFERAKRIAGFQAELSELVRDYNVTRQIYEDMLERKEKARMSMTLDIEGQGVTYRMQEPPEYPNLPVGLRFLHFYLAAPFLGVLVPVALVVALIQLDTRLRFASKLEDGLPEQIVLLGVIPRLGSSVDERRVRAQFMAIGVFLSIVLLAYVSIAVVRLLGAD